jgi:hypothetical protein
MREPAEAAPAAHPGMLFRLGLAVTGIVTLLFGLFPAMLDVADNAARVLKGS